METGSAARTNFALFSAAAGVLLVIYAAWLALGLGGEFATLLVADLGMVLIVLIAALPFVWQSQRTRGVERLAWFLLGLSLFSWAVGEVVWSYYEIVLHRPTPIPSAADLGYLAAVPFAAGGLLCFLLESERSAQALVRAILDGLVIASSLLLVSWTIVLRPVFESSQGDALTTTLLLAYPLGDLLLASLVLTVAYTRRESRAPWWFLGAGTLLWAVAHSEFARLEAIGNYENGFLIDVSWAAGFLLMGLGAARAATLPWPSTLPLKDPPILLTMTPYFAAALGIVAGLASFLTVGIDPLTIWIGASFVTLLIVRQQLTTLEVRRLTKSLRRATADLMARNEQLAAAQSISLTGSWEWDIQRGTMMWSDEMHNLFGSDGTLGKVTMDGFVMMLHPDDRAPFNASLKNCVETGASFVLKHTVVRRDGRNKELLSRAEPIKDGRGKVIRIRGTEQDITETQRLERQRMELEMQKSELKRLKDIDAFKTRFMNSTAHELNTPLTPIRLQVHLMKEQLKEDAKNPLGGNVRILDRSVERLTRLIQDVLDSTRIQGGHLTLKTSQVRVDQLVNETAETFAATAKTAGLALTTEAAPDLVVHGDEGRLMQILSNLVTNAIKFTPRGGRITVRAEGADAKARISVADTGPGFTEAEKSRLFQPFSQLDTTPHPHSGTGLGLYISRGIAQMHGGNLWAESPGPGQGATFILELPMGENALPPGTRAKPRRPDAPNIEDRIRSMI